MVSGPIFWAQKLLFTELYEASKQTMNPSIQGYLNSSIQEKYRLFGGRMRALTTCYRNVFFFLKLINQVES